MDKSLHIYISTYLHIYLDFDTMTEIDTFRIIDTSSYIYIYYTILYNIVEYSIESYISYPLFPHSSIPYHWIRSPYSSLSVPVH